VFKLEGRVALITGAASGIGAATARRFAQAGASVVCGWYGGDAHNVEPVVEAIRASGGTAVAVEADVSSTDDVRRLVETAQGELGRLDIVVANAGVARDIASEELDDEQWRWLTEIDLLGVFRCFREAIPAMREQGWGRLLATSSISGAILGWPRHVHYSAAKAGVLVLVRALALEVGPWGITVNAVIPGVIVTPQSSDPIHSLGPEGLAAYEARVPVGRNGRPEDVANAFHFLASEEATYVTGQTLVVDGGSTVAY
jgi:3-oxoacyl-[acyl-carrier protein] reductase